MLIVRVLSSLVLIVIIIDPPCTPSSWSCMACVSRQSKSRMKSCGAGCTVWLRRISIWKRLMQLRWRAPDLSSHHKRAWWCWHISFPRHIAVASSSRFCSNPLISRFRMMQAKNDCLLKAQSLNSVSCQLCSRSLAKTRSCLLQSYTLSSLRFAYFMKQVI